MAVFPSKNNWYRYDFSHWNELKIKYEYDLPIDVNVDWRLENNKSAEKIVKEAKKLNKKIAITYSGGYDSTITMLSFLENNIKPLCIVFAPYIPIDAKYYPDQFFLESNIKLTNLLKSYFDIPENTILSNAYELKYAIENINLYKLDYIILPLDLYEYTDKIYPDLIKTYPTCEPEYCWQIYNILKIQDYKKFFICASAGDINPVFKNNIWYMMDNLSWTMQDKMWYDNSIVGTARFCAYTGEQFFGLVFNDRARHVMSNFKSTSLDDWWPIKSKIVDYYYPKINVPDKKTMNIMYKRGEGKNIYSCYYRPNYYPLHSLLDNLGKTISYEISINI